MTQCFFVVIALPTNFHTVQLSSPHTLLRYLYLSKQRASVLRGKIINFFLSPLLSSDASNLLVFMFKILFLFIFMTFDIAWLLFIFKLFFCWNNNNNFCFDNNNNIDFISNNAFIKFKFSDLKWLWNKYKAEALILLKLFGCTKFKVVY